MKMTAIHISTENRELLELESTLDDSMTTHKLACNKAEKRLHKVAPSFTSNSGKHSKSINYLLVPFQYPLTAAPCKAMGVRNDHEVVQPHTMDAQLEHEL